MSIFRKSTVLCSLDSETLTRWDDAIILSVAAVTEDITVPWSFQELVDRAWFAKLDATEQSKAGRKADTHTKSWWGQQSEEAKRMSLYPSPDDLQMEQLYRSLDTHLEDKPKELGVERKEIEYADRNLFDFRKLQHMFEVTMGKEVLWNYHNLRDFTTMLESLGDKRYGRIYPNDIPPRFGFIYHDPRHDAALDWLRVQDIMVRLGFIELPKNYQFNGLFYEKRT